MKRMVKLSLKFNTEKNTFVNGNIKHTFHKKTSESMHKDSPKPFLKQNIMRRKSLDYLYATYPKCFIGKNKKPLKIGIHKNVFADLPKEFTKLEKKHLKKAIQYYCNNIFYLKEIVTGTPRIDLNGNIVSQITDKEKSHAKFLLKQYEKKKKVKNDTKNSN